MVNLQQYGPLRDFPVSTLDVSDYFFRGQAAMAFRGPWTIAYGQGTYPKVKFDYVNLPSYTSQPPYFAAESGWSDAVTAVSPHKDVAWDFVKFMNSKDNDRYWNITTSTIPARKDLTDDAGVPEGQPAAQADPEHPQVRPLDRPGPGSQRLLRQQHPLHREGLQPLDEHHRRAARP